MHPRVAQTLHGPPAMQSSCSLAAITIPTSNSEPYFTPLWLSLYMLTKD